MKINYKRLTAEMVERLGHRASTCASGDEAAEQCKIALTSDRPFDIVIMDLLVAKGMGGLELHERSWGLTVMLKSSHAVAMQLNQ